MVVLVAEQAAICSISQLVVAPLACGTCPLSFDRCLLSDYRPRYRRGPFFDDHFLRNFTATTLHGYSIGFFTQYR
jgi:hypothetical protein